MNTFDAALGFNENREKLEKAGYKVFGMRCAVVGIIDGAAGL